MSPKRSPLSTVFEEYEKIAGKSIEDSIKSETHGSLEQAMLTVGTSELGPQTRVSEGHSAQRPSSAQGNHSKWLGPYVHLQGTPPPAHVVTLCPSVQDTGMLHPQGLQCTASCRWLLSVLPM